jgi:hypothetical protein
VTAREFFGCVGLLAAFALAVVNASCTPDQIRKVEHTADKVTTIVQAARDAGDKSCDKAVPSCSVYADAVRAGLVRDDDRAELACAKVATVCALLGAAGAP